MNAGQTQRHEKAVTSTINSYHVNNFGSSRSLTPREDPSPKYSNLHEPERLIPQTGSAERQPSSPPIHDDHKNPLVGLLSHS
jgi:hypothetical protein